MQESVNKSAKDFATGRINEREYKQAIDKIHEKINKKLAALELLMQDLKNKISNFGKRGIPWNKERRKI